MPSVRRTSASQIPELPSHASQPTRQAQPPTAGSPPSPKGGWVSQPPQSPARALIASAQTAALALKPSIGKANATSALAALGDGSATIEVPLKPGKYSLPGPASFKVLPGTVAHVQVKVKDGELVPMQGDTGTKLRIEPPLDLPLWITGKGARLVGDEARQKIQLELGGFFDLKFKSQKLSELAAGTADGHHGGNGASGTKAASKSLHKAPAHKAAELLTKMLDLDALKVDAQVTMRQSNIDVGGMQIQVDPATALKVKGDGKTATLSGHVEFDAFALSQGGVAVSGSGGSADLVAKLTRAGDGHQVDSVLSGIKLQANQIRSSHASATVPGKTDEIFLGPTQITDGEIRAKSRIGSNGLRPTGLKQETVSMSIKGSGVLQDARLAVRDDRDAASLGISGKFEGSIEMGNGNSRIDASLREAHVDISDLQQSVGENRVSIHHARADGEVHVRSDPQSGQLQLDGEMRNIDILVDDFKGGAGKMSADLGRTSLRGDGQFHVGAKGVQVDGRLRGETTIDSAQFEDSAQGGQLGAGSTASGELTKLDLGKGSPTIKLENVAVDLKLKNATLDVGDASVSGAGRVKGRSNMTLDGSGLNLDGTAQISLEVAGGHIHTSTVDMEFAQGSKAELSINQLQMGKVTQVGIGPGSKVQAVLKSGQLRVDGQNIDLHQGALATLDVKSVRVSEGKPPELRGGLSLQGEISADQLRLDTLEEAGVKLRPLDAQGRLSLAIEDAHLSNNKITFQGGRLALDAQLGKVIGVAVPGQSPMGSLQKPPEVLSVDEVKRKSALEIAGAKGGPVAAASSPAEALRLLEQGAVKLEMPLHGAIHALGMDLVKFPPGAQLQVSLGVKDGKVVPAATTLAFQGGVRAIGVQVRGIRVTEKFKVRIDLKFAGRSFSLPVPFVRVPSDMNRLADLVSRFGGTGNERATSPQGGEGKLDKLFDPNNTFDLAHAKLDVTEATFGRGRLAVPGGELQLAPGSKLSFHGTLDAAELSGSVKLDQVAISREELALKGSLGVGDLRLSYKHDKGRMNIDGSLSNLTLHNDYIVRKEADGDYVSLGAGTMAGASVSLRSDVEVDEHGLPKKGAKMRFDGVAMTVPSFDGQLQGARVTSPQAQLPGQLEMGPSHLSGRLAFSEADGLSLKSTFQNVDVGVKGVQVQRGGKPMDLETGRLRGAEAKLELSRGHLTIDTPNLGYDLVLRNLEAQGPRQAMKSERLHVRGNGHFGYDSQGELVVEGRLLVDAKLAGSTDVTPLSKSAPVSRVAIHRQRGVSIGSSSPP